ncbi:MAG: amino acid ABC transporter permease [Ectothiorhodospiraceae bacterium]|nr:amino acid ABC transporter permease [Chromatiales bacterium]MCP5154238.1 amino acid ABC transporter permease [Ectothiorhodospiraceae bacterium]
MSETVTRLVAYWESIASYMPGFLDASWLAFEITLLVIAVSWGCGLLAALGKLSRLRVLRWPATFYVWFIRGTPTLVQVFLFYFGLPQTGLRLSPFVAGVLALGINSGAYVAEIVRGGLAAMPRGQMESALALGMSPALAMRRIILPQVVRMIIPPITNEAASALKNTSLLSTITLVELTLHSQLVIAATYRPFDFYLIAAVLYLLMTTVLTQLAAWFERRFRLDH